MDYLTLLHQRLDQFTPLGSQRLYIPSSVFTKHQQNIADFVLEAQKSLATLQELSAHNADPDLIKEYRQKFQLQYSLIHQAVQKLKGSHTPLSVKKIKKFRSKFSFSAQIHKLKPQQRLKEYYLVLRTLDEKIDFYQNQLLIIDDPILRAQLFYIIEHNQAKRLRCFNAIENLEQDIL